MKLAYLIFTLTIIEINAQIGVPEVDNAVDFDDINEDTGAIQNLPFDLDVVDELVEDIPVLDNFLGDTNQNIPGPPEEEISPRRADADPTLHKWKHKRPILHSHAHTHIHTVTHGNSYDFGTPDIHPAHQVIQQTKIMNPIKYPITTGQNFQTNLDSNQWNSGYQQHAHSTYNQGSLSQQKTQTYNHNNNFGSFGRPTYSQQSPKLDTNMNGQTNTYINSGGIQSITTFNNGHGSVQGKRASSQTNVNEPLIGISMPLEETMYWPQTPPKTPGEANPSVYDSEMNQILNILDERSYHQERPEVEPTNNRRNAEYTPPKKDMNAQTDVDYNLKSSFLIQVPSNDFFHSYNYERNRRDRRSYKPRDINMKLLSDNSMLFNITNLKLEQINSKIDKTLNDYRDMVDKYRKKLTDKREVLFVDILDSFIGQYQRRKDEESNEVKNIQKRSATITKLLNNPDVQLDVPKTLDNIGIITRNAFEDERSPMYHVRKFMGSTKNAVLSAMKIPPQNLVIPSNYEIKNINPEEITEEEDHLVSGINPKILSRSGFRNSESSEDVNDPYAGDPFGIVETFARVGGAIRDSVRSSQNTLNHISNIAHDARKIFHTTKNSAPRILLPYAKAPVLTSRFKDNKNAPLKKAIIISPKVLDIKDPNTGDQRSDPEYVSMGHILDAIGLTKPNKDQIDLEKIVVRMPGQGETRGIYIPPIGEVKSVNGRKIPTLKDNVGNKRRTKEKLDRIQERVASTSKAVRNNIAKLKNDLTMTLDKTKNKVKSDLLQMKERNNIDEILGQSRTQNDTRKNTNGLKHFTKEEEDEIIDKFLHNIFEIDHDPKSHSEPVVTLSRIEKMGNNTTIQKKTKEKKNYDTLFGNSKSFSPDITKAELEETIKNITLDVLREENENKNLIIKNSKPIRTRKGDFMKKPRKTYRKEPKIVLQSRFGEDEDLMPITTEKYNETTLTIKDVDKNEDEAMRKVDEYVLNDVFNPSISEPDRGENVKSSWKIGNLEFIEDPSAEESSNELGDSEEEEQIPKFSSRNLLRQPGTEDKMEVAQKRGSEAYLRRKRQVGDEMVGLNLPPALMSPFMARLSNPNIDEAFRNKDEEIKDQISHNEEDDNKNNNAEQILGLNLPPELMKPFMARDANTDVDKTFTSDENYEPNVLSETDEMSNYLPLLMMPHRSPKSVKKTLDEFIKKENETKQQILNTQENRLKQSTTEERYLKQNVAEETYVIPPSETMQRIAGRFQDKCQMKRCYESPRDTFEDSPDEQSFQVCICISTQDSDSYENTYTAGMEGAGDEPHARKGVGQSRTAMAVSEALRKPFMGLGNEDTIKKFYQEYNKEHVEDDDVFGSEEEKLLFSDDHEE